MQIKNTVFVAIIRIFVFLGSVGFEPTIWWLKVICITIIQKSLLYVYIYIYIMYNIFILFTPINIYIMNLNNI